MKQFQIFPKMGSKISKMNHKAVSHVRRKLFRSSGSVTTEAEKLGLLTLKNIRSRGSRSSTDQWSHRVLFEMEWALSRIEEEDEAVMMEEQSKPQHISSQQESKPSQQILSPQRSTSPPQTSTPPEPSQLPENSFNWNSDLETELWLQSF
jgi:hypothetical protein